MINITCESIIVLFGLMPSTDAIIVLFAINARAFFFIFLPEICAIQQKKAKLFTMPYFP